MAYPKYYDLNISDNVLTHLDIEDALKEIISNAIDEHNSIEPKPKKDIEIGQNSKGKWFIRDYGRGLKIKHFVYGENCEKTKNTDMMGFFGFGIKDGIGGLYSKNITFKIYTKSYIYTPIMHAKSDFPDNETLHMQVIQNKTYDIKKGTEFIFDNLTLESINNAKSKFVKFNNPTILFENEECKMFKLATYQSIFINGVEVQTNTGLHFSYDIRSTEKIRKLFNRDRKEMNIKLVMKYIHDICLKKIVITNNHGELFNTIQYILGLDDKLLQEFNQIDILRSLVYQINNFNSYVFVGAKEKYKDIIDKITTDKKEIFILGDGCKKKFGVKNIRELYNPNKFWKKLSTDDKTGILTLIDYGIEPKNFDFTKIIIPIEKLFKKLPDIIKENIRNIVIDDIDDTSDDDDVSCDEINNDNQIITENKDNKLRKDGYDFDALPLRVSRKLTNEKCEEKLFAALTKYIIIMLPDEYFGQLKSKEKIPENPEPVKTPEIQVVKPKDPPKSKRSWLGFGF